jgi:G:T-mismatch repair DNA endonuclease (very short patch repair protein)
MNCLHCKQPTKNPKYCSHTCRSKITNKNRATRSEASKNQTSETLKSTIATKPKNYNKKVCRVSFCTICCKTLPFSDNSTCSKACLKLRYQQIGRNLAANLNNRSKDEIKLYDLCFSAFTNVKHNEQLVDGWDADIILSDHKIAILWNGPWHYSEMPGLIHSLSQVQNRDTIKINTLQNAGWQVIVFRDDLYTPQTAFEALKLVVSEGLEPKSLTAYETAVLPLNELTLI